MENDELELDLDSIEANAEKKDRVKNRIEQLSTKVITASKERDDALGKVTSLETSRIEAEKERDFYKNFASNVSKYPNASDYQDKILEKVKSGYEVEDAMVAVLAKEGKLGNQQSTEDVPQYQHHAEGGSAATVIPGNKSIGDMSADEKLNALKEADKSGELARALLGM